MTYIVRPFMAPVYSSVISARISAGGRQLLVGPASISLLGADEGAVLDPGHVVGVGQGEVAVRALRVGQALERAAVDQQLRQPVVLLLGPVAPLDGVGLEDRGPVVDPVEQFGVLWWAA